ncbi:MAG: hypothetical protein WC647_10660 [Desulfomonilaceae bacterium]
MKTSAEINTIPLIALVLFTFSLSLALLIGNIGFQGDDWWQFSWPYWFPFPQSIWEYVKASSRPIEGIYTVLVFDVFGLNRILYTLSALILSAGSCLLLASTLKRAFPSKASLPVIGAFLAFFLTPVSNLIYMFHTDNSRLSMLFFWISAFSFQRWAQRSCSWIGLIPPALFYLLAAFTYENTTFILFGVPLLVWPVYSLGEKAVNEKAFFIRLFAGIAGSFALFVLVRFLVFSGGAVKQSSLIPPIDLVFKYFSNLVIYAAFPFHDIPGDSVSWLWATPAALVLAALVFYSLRRSPPSQVQKLERWNQGFLYIGMLGITFVILGMLPYLMAGYNSTIGFTSQSRIYSSASFGLAILLASIVVAPAHPRTRALTHTLAIIAICLMAAFMAGLRHEWQDAERQRQRLTRTLLEQAPQVAPGSTFLFLDLQSYITAGGVDRAVVFQGVDGLGEWARILYRNRNIYAYFLYSQGEAFKDDEGRTASVSPQGVIARGSVTRGLIPLDSLIIVKRDVNRLRILDSLSEQDHAAAINWKGISQITTNRNLIIRP